jgi:hypothetical protein
MITVAKSAQAVGNRGFIERMRAPGVLRADQGLHSPPDVDLEVRMSGPALVLGRSHKTGTTSPTPGGRRWVRPAKRGEGRGSGPKESSLEKDSVHAHPLDDQPRVHSSSPCH